MKTLLVALNAKYIHSNLAVYSIYEYATEKMSKQDGENVAMAEYTINNQMDSVIRDIYMKRPEAIFFSCYIWNIEYINDIARELKKLLPDTHMWFGGPEVSYDGEGVFVKYPYLKGIMTGEGEETAYELLNLYNTWQYNENHLDEQLEKVCGISYCSGKEHITTPPRALMNMDELPFVYKDFSIFKNRIIYYESSRGCPFNCSYCMSSIDKSVRFRSLELVKKELQIFLDNKVPQVKFIDRTFNINPGRTVEILKFILDKDNGITNFHFEIAADLINDEEIQIMSMMRPGLIQLEIGVQSTNEVTIDAISRKMEFEKVALVVEKVSRAENIHIHLDLIAGLPFENLDSFKKSFNQVYALKPGELQLGFLKVLKGANMHKSADNYGIVYSDKAPYEVLKTNWISFDDIIKLKFIEEMVEVYYNSGLFSYTMNALEKCYDNAYEMYEALAGYYEENGLFDIKHSRITRYEILEKFIVERLCENEDGKYGKSMIKYMREILVFDLYLRENLKTRPGFAKEWNVYKEATRESYAKYSKEYDGKYIHIEAFEIDIPKLMEDGSIEEACSMVLFDYDNKHPVTNRARVTVIGR